VVAFDHGIDAPDFGVAREYNPVFLVVFDLVSHKERRHIVLFDIPVYLETGCDLQRIQRSARCSL
jgi:hypothetical protein